MRTWQSLNYGDTAKQKIKINKKTTKTNVLLLKKKKTTSWSIRNMSPNMTTSHKQCFSYLHRRPSPSQTNLYNFTLSQSNCLTFSLSPANRFHQMYFSPFHPTFPVHQFTFPDLTQKKKLYSFFSFQLYFNFLVIHLNS